MVSDEEEEETDDESESFLRCFFLWFLLLLWTTTIPEFRREEREECLSSLETAMIALKRLDIRLLLLVGREIWECWWNEKGVRIWNVRGLLPLSGCHDSCRQVAAQILISFADYGSHYHRLLRSPSS